MNDGEYVYLTSAAAFKTAPPGATFKIPRADLRRRNRFDPLVIARLRLQVLNSKMPGGELWRISMLHFHRLIHDSIARGQIPKCQGDLRLVNKLEVCDI